MSDLDPQDDVLRELLGRLASSAARSVPTVQAPERIRRRGTARRNRRTAAGLVSAGLAVAAVAGVVSEASALRSAPVQPARTPSVSVTGAPSPTGSPSVSPSRSPSAPSSPSGARPSRASSSSTTTASAAAVPAPTAQVQRPWSRAGAEFGVLVAVRSAANGVVVTYTPRTFDPYGGPRGPAQPARTATVRNGAYVSASSFLAPEASLPAEGVPITTQQFATRARAAIAKKQPVGVWFFHATTDLTSPITGVQEQYRP